MHVEISYNRPMVYGSTAMGRNGRMFCNGLSMWSGKTLVSVYPITSKGTEGNCCIDIPLEDIDKVIEALKKMKEED